MLNNLNIKKMVENTYFYSTSNGENEALKYNSRSKEQLKDMENELIELIEMLIKESLNNMF